VCNIILDISLFDKNHRATYANWIRMELDLSMLFKRELWINSQII